MESYISNIHFSSYGDYSSIVSSATNLVATESNTATALSGVSLNCTSVGANVYGTNGIFGGMDSANFTDTALESSMQALNNDISETQKLINDIVNTKIEEKKQNIKANFLEKKIEEDIISEEYLDKYYEELKKETEIINDKLELELNEEICVEFSPKLAAKYKLDSTEQLERINSRINVLFKNNIISKVKSQTEFRDESLKNMFTESYNKYLELNKNTVEEK